jgi:two-component system, response regulator PdtaR
MAFVNPRNAGLLGPGPAEHSATPERRRRGAPTRRAASASQQEAADTPRILIVEDDFLVAMQAESALTEAGFTSAGIAISAEEAIALAISQRPALVLMDIRLAGQRDGIDAAFELLGKLNIRCIFATAHQDPGTRRRAEPAHPLGWLQKPYTMASLVETVRRGLREVG